MVMGNPVNIFTKGDLYPWAVAFGGIGLLIGVALLSQNIQGGVDLRNLSLAKTNGQNPYLPNPAAIYCAHILNYQYKIISDDGEGQRGICIMPGGAQCDEWKFYAGECGQKYNYCTQQGYQSGSSQDGKDPYSPRYTVCISPATHQILGSATSLSRLPTIINS